MIEMAGEEVEQFTRVALVARALTTALDASEIVDIVVHQGMAGLHAEGGVLVLLDANGELVPAVMVGYPPDAMAAFAPLTIDLDLPLTAAARDNEAIWISSRRDAETRFPALVAGSVTATQAWAAIPLVAEGVVLGVLGVSFVAPREFSEAERLFICALVDLSALALGAHRLRAPRPAEPETATLALLDSATNRVFTSTLTLAGVSRSRGANGEVANKLQDVIDELDAANREIRSTAIALFLRDGDARSARPRDLCRFDDGQLFAYARGHDFFRVSDSALWAHASDDLLLSARSGTPLARRVGEVFYDVESGAPLYIARQE